MYGIPINILSGLFKGALLSMTLLGTRIIIKQTLARCSGRSQRKLKLREQTQTLMQAGEQLQEEWERTHANVRRP